MSDTDLTPSDGPDSKTGSAPLGTGLETSPVGPSWQEQDILLRDLWVQNKPPPEIAAVLGRSVAAIMTRAARLGLPRRAAPGRKPGSRRLSADGSNEMRTALPRVSTAQHREVAMPTTQRICLMCLRSFQSQGRHNRICSSCKGSSEYESAVALADINFPI